MYSHKSGCPLLEETEESDDDILDNDYIGNLRSKSNQCIEDQNVAFTPTIPIDKYKFTYVIFYLLGMTSLIPWNFFITAESYWLYKFRNVSASDTDDDLTPTQRDITSDLTISASVSGTIFLILNALFSYKIPLRLRMLGSMLIILLLFVTNTAFVEVNTDSWQCYFFILTMTIVVLINSFAAILCGGLVGIAGLFPSEYITAVVSGQALGGVFASLAMIASLTFGASPKTTAFVYFFIGIIMLVISVITYVVMSRTTFFRHYVCSKESTLQVFPSQEILYNEGSSVPNALIVFKKVYLYAVSECFVFAITLSVYPAITVLVQSQYYGNGNLWNDVYFKPVVNYLTFNFGDYIGRVLAGFLEKPKNKPHLVMLSAMVRAGFIPALMMTNTGGHNYLPVIIQSDITFISIMFVFAVSNGYLANAALIMAPKYVKIGKLNARINNHTYRAVMHHEKEMASSIMAAFLSIGLMLGSATSLVLIHLL